MANKLGKFLLGLTAAGAAGAGVYYYLKKKNDAETEDEFDEDFDDDFEDEDFDLDDDLGEVTEREYVTLTPSSDSVSDTAKGGEAEATDKAEETEATSSDAKTE